MLSPSGFQTTEYIGFSLYTKLLLKLPVFDQIFIQPSSPEVAKEPPS